MAAVVAILLQCDHEGAQYKLMRFMFTLRSSGFNMLHLCSSTQTTILL